MIGKVWIKSDFPKVPGRLFVDIICLIRFVELHPFLSRLNLQGFLFAIFVGHMCFTQKKKATAGGA